MAKDEPRHHPTGRTVTEKRPRMARPQELSALLASIFDGKPAAKLLKEIVIWQVWDEVVGPQVARRARPAAIRDGLLTVTVASGPWLQQLTFLKGEIIAQLNEKIGDALVREIYLKAGNPHQAKRPPVADRPVSRPLTAEEERLIDRQVSQIEDGDLRKELAALLRRHRMSSL